MGRPVDLVLFDVDGTLIYVAPDPRDTFLEACRSLGLDLDRAAVDRGYDATTAFWWEEGLRYAGDEAAFWLEFDRRVLEAAGVPDPDGRLARQVKAWFPPGSHLNVYPDVRPALEPLRRAGLPAVAVTGNWFRHPLARLGLDDLLDGYVWAGRVGVAKPDPRLYQAALAAAPAPVADPGRVALVGNDLLDVEAARAMGFRPVLVDRHGRYDGDQAGDGVRIRSLGELAGLLLT